MGRKHLKYTNFLQNLSLRYIVALVIYLNSTYPQTKAFQKKDILFSGTLDRLNIKLHFWWDGHIFLQQGHLGQLKIRHSNSQDAHPRELNCVFSAKQNLDSHCPTCQLMQFQERIQRERLGHEETRLTTTVDKL